MKPITKVWIRYVLGLLAVIPIMVPVIYVVTQLADYIALAYEPGFVRWALKFLLAAVAIGLMVALMSRFSGKAYREIQEHKAKSQR